jgi:hypothetical protein
MVATLPAGVLASLTTQLAFWILWREVDKEERFGLLMAAANALRQRRRMTRRGIFMVAKTVAFVVRAVLIFMSF